MEACPCICPTGQESPCPGPLCLWQGVPRQGLPACAVHTENRPSQAGIHTSSGPGPCLVRALLADRCSICTWLVTFRPLPYDLDVLLGCCIRSINQTVLG
ncbi:UDP-GlcNAc:betaGal beta-1,3-N-acetylglucosaminyltransferase 7 [Platysternon megacephalum]|uniref:UDP-GlcNAc:betaGal beta-1,3-N-acetylglucosaminyltransferase 7 n=1 Tax=Platysternon megacephalum TaxID=55544 RepID=A0A4D9EH35_9SAUR|nr:UDP-GlcNAc:betaGal beta-1,3-N-acetylglucosaminyltransferase 7 [Platysternon megacephalum]